MGKLAKDEMRKQLLANRPGSSSGLSERLIALASQLSAKVIASYVPLASEPDVAQFNRWALQGRIAFPRIDGDDLVFASGDMQRGSLGIMEPSGEAVDPAAFDLIVIPAVAADLHGSRLGKGKGFYDRFLPKVNAIKVAVVFDNELIAELPTESHDATVDYVVTPVRTVRVGG